MPGVYMAQFVSQQGRQLGLVVQGKQNTPGAGNGSAGKGIGIDIDCIDHMKIKGHVRPMGLGGDIFASMINIVI